MNKIYWFSKHNWYRVVMYLIMIEFYISYMCSIFLCLLTQHTKRMYNLPCIALKVNMTKSSQIISRIFVITFLSTYMFPPSNGHISKAYILTKNLKCSLTKILYIKKAYKRNSYKIGSKLFYLKLWEICFLYLMKLIYENFIPFPSELLVVTIFTLCLDEWFQQFQKIKYLIIKLFVIELSSFLK